MSKQTIEIEVPEGYTAIKYGRPSKGCLYLCDGEVYICEISGEMFSEYIIVEEKQ